MPEAMSRPCGHVEVIEASVRREGDGEHYADFATDSCPRVADHEVIVAIEGREEWHTEHLCCFHRSALIDEVMSSELLGIEIIADLIMQPVFDWSVRQGPEGWECVVVVTSGATGARHTLPPARLHSTNRVAASIEAAAQVNRLRSIAAGNEDGGIPL